MNNNNSETKTDIMEGGRFTSRYAKNYKDSMHAIEICEHLASCSSVNADELYKYLDVLTIAEAKKRNKTANKRTQVKEAEFKAVGLKTVPTVYNLFRQKFKAKVGDDYTGEAFNQEYNTLSKKQKDELYYEISIMKEKYNTEYEKQKLRAIYEGEYPPAQVKRKTNARFMLSKICSNDKLKKKLLTKTQMKKMVNMPKKLAERTEVITSIWESLSEAQMEQLTDMVTYDGIRQKCQMFEREVLVLEAGIRKAKRNGDTVTVSLLNADLTKLNQNVPDEYQEYIENDDYAPLYDFTELEQDSEAEE